MGANVWKRGGAEAGASHSQHVKAATPHQQRQLQPQQQQGSVPKKKTVWKRTAAGDPGQSGSNQVSGQGSSSRPEDGNHPNKRLKGPEGTNGVEDQSRASVQGVGSEEDQDADGSIRAAAERVLAEKLAAKQAELDAFKRKIALEEMKIEQRKRVAEQKEALERADEVAKKDARMQRKDRLEAGFAEAFRKAKEMAEAEAAVAESTGRPLPKYAGEADVKRVLDSNGPYDVLQLKQGADAATIRRKYKELAMFLHPDKCKVEGATDAFQKLMTAYQSLQTTVLR